jgi:hypothetical protein
MIKANGKWQTIDKEISFKIEKEITAITNDHTSITECERTTDLLIIQKPYEIVKTTINYTNDYFNKIGETQIIKHMYLELIDKYPNKNYILFHKDIGLEMDKKITYIWAIK